MYHSIPYIHEVYPRTQEELESRLELANILQIMAATDKENQLLVHHTKASFLYLRKKEDYDQYLQSIDHKYILDCTEPENDRVLTIHESLHKNDDLRKTLYFNKYKHKLTFETINNNVSHLDVSKIARTLESNTDIKLNKPMRDALDFTHMFWWRYREHCIYCLDESALMYALLMVGDDVKRIQNAVLFSDLV